MNWIYVKTTEDVVMNINLDAVMCFYYKADTDLTVIEFTRAAYPAVYVKGDITLNIRRLLNTHNSYVSQIGV